MDAARSRVVAGVAATWTVVATALGVEFLLNTTASGRAVVATATIVGAAAAGCATWAAGNHRPRRAGAFLAVSVVVPTGFAYVLNIVVLMMAIYLLVSPPHESVSSQAQR